MLKDKKKLIIILTSIIVLIIGILLAVILLKNNDEGNSGNKGNNQNEEVKIPDAPAENTENLVQELEKMEVVSLSNDVIKFDEKITVQSGEKVAVWVYSSPKFLGYFEVFVEDGVKMIKGLQEAMKDLEVEAGNHNLAIVTEKGESVGYIDIYIEENKLFEDEQAAIVSKYTTKEVKEEIEVKYETITTKDANKKSGTKEVTQKGVNGISEVTYKITYDENGKEISKEKISVKVIKEVVNEKVVVGTANFNTNTSKITSKFTGFMCTEDQTMLYEGTKGCNDMLELSGFSAISIDNSVYYIIKINDNSITPIKVTKNGFLYKGTYKGTTYYFDSRSGGGEDIPLTSEVCKQYNLNCGSW